MRKIAAGIILLAASAFAQAEPFTEYIHQYQSPELFDNNVAALDARLKLLDMAPAGGQAMIATFNFDNGRTVRQLARHICKAQERGVNVELLTDGKSGAVAGRENAFNASEDAKTVEEIYQYMANCGAAVYVHNPVSNYIEISGQRMPNIFLDPQYNGKTFSGLLGSTSLLTFKNRVDALVSHAADLINAGLQASGMRADSHALLKHFESFALNFIEANGALKDLKDPNDEPAWVKTTFEDKMRRDYVSMVGDSVWDAIDAGRLKAALPRIAKRFKADPVFSRLGAEIRRFNRLNHRKMFLVQSADGKEGCLMLGGRNLGDSYLYGTSLSFIDGDAFICRHQSPEIDQAINEAVASFKDLKTNTSDPMLNAVKDNHIIKIAKNPAYPYSFLAFPSDIAPKGLRFGTYSGKLPVNYRILIAEKKWGDVNAVHGDLPLLNTSGWRLLTAGWNPAGDQIQHELLKMVRAETKQIYIETAYGEFNTELRTALETAMKQGVKVTFITNSMFISDGASKFIRILMDNWMERMKGKYRDLFDVNYTTAEARHMTHFKGAAFACQGGGDQAHRSYLIGSHNFHPRSGRTDKEHALMWNEPAGDGCSKGFNGYPDMVHARLELYDSFSAKGLKTLAYYEDLDDEMAIVASGSGKTDPASKVLGNELRQVFYEVHADGGVLRENARVKWILNLADQSGLHDLIGLMF
jgi:phosphatidylserine/phosphatidylglycerophosphate/cardiolipin synthase-like enzyme